MQQSFKILIHLIKNQQIYKDLVRRILCQQKQFFFTIEESRIKDETNFQASSQKYLRTYEKSYKCHEVEEGQLKVRKNEDNILNILKDKVKNHQEAAIVLHGLRVERERCPNI
ncbi:unnamed protein product (macronuclear) [Paramecium tetraurelia]|uniref:Uncharacterized protein n=1 Tax=Paramecium tetraurelia TaxID=5888 RepID=A0CFJ6_PARTE|nr:uncharacterized protein GSPATT00038003001 [Paramecium tetraurelia]CAK69563.1 unnamed protein product [Paramecium tetraurelia]|eukprot:XP_001436960.1 hypothetical protein (macronuclear) [Paramecium tetraurelia strain d4-2]